MLIALGRVVNVHALRGELRVLLFNPGSTTLQAGGDVVLRRGQEQQPRRVTGVRRHKQLLLLRLDGCDTIAAAQELIGCEVCVSAADLPPTAAGEVYHYELLGMQVVTTAGTEIGTIAEVLATPGNDVCVVRAGAREHLIPFVADVVKQVDREGRRLVIEPVPGLLDI